MTRPLCKAKSRRFDTGAKKGLGRAWRSACLNHATHDLDGTGVLTACYAHSKAAAEKKRAKRQREYDARAAQIEAMKQKWELRKAKRGASK